MSDRDDTSPEKEGRDLRPAPRGWYVLVPAAALLIGVLLGALVVGVAGDDDGQDGAEPEPGSPSVTPNGTGVVVPDECLAAAETVEQVITTLREGIGTIREFQPDGVLAMLDELEDLEARARRQAAACRGTSITDVPGSPAGTPPQPTTVPPTPTATTSPS